MRLLTNWKEIRMELEEDLPTFRPFTREELNTIENRIFENKLAAKKKQETRDKNIAVRKPLLKMNIIPLIDKPFVIGESLSE